MDIFQRSIHSNVKQIGEDRVLVTSQLLDLEHSFHVEMTVRLSDGLIESARAVMTKSPYKRCLPLVETVGRIAGLKIGRGVFTEMNNLIGGPRGCAHLVELITDAVRLIAMIRLGMEADYVYGARETEPEEEIIARSRGLLRNTCRVYADEE